MVQSTKNPKQPVKKSSSYLSNPFSLSFEKLGLFFEKNRGWAVSLLVISAISFFLSYIPSDTPSNSDTSFEEYLTSQEASSTDDRKQVEQETQTEIEKSFGAITKDQSTLTFFVTMFSLMAIVTIVFVLLIFAISTYIRGVLAYVALENDAGRHATLSASIEATSQRFWRLFQAELLAQLKIFGWTLLLIIPGIIAAFRYALLPYVIMDESAKQKGITSSHDRIKTLVAGRKREVFGVWTVANILPVIGILNGLIGESRLYRQLQISHDQNIQKPPIHWLNYLGIILAIFFFALIALFVVLILQDPTIFD